MSEPEKPSYIDTAWGYVAKAGQAIGDAAKKAGGEWRTIVGWGGGLAFARAVVNFAGSEGWLSWLWTALIATLTIPATIVSMNKAFPKEETASSAQEQTDEPATASRDMPGGLTPAPCPAVGHEACRTR